MENGYVSPTGARFQALVRRAQRPDAGPRVGGVGPPGGVKLATRRCWCGSAWRRETPADRTHASRSKVNEWEPKPLADQISGSARSQRARQTREARRRLAAIRKEMGPETISSAERDTDRLPVPGELLHCPRIRRESDASCSLLSGPHHPCIISSRAMKRGWEQRESQMGSTSRTGTERQEGEGRSLFRRSMTSDVPGPMAAPGLYLPARYRALATAASSFSTPSYSGSSAAISPRPCAPTPSPIAPWKVGNA